MDVLKENLATAVMIIIVFVGGVGIGAAITDAINSWNPKDKK